MYGLHTLCSARCVNSADDAVVAVKNTDDAVEALKAAGNTDVKYTRYDTAPPCVTANRDLIGHGSYELAFADSEMYTWLLEQSL